ncbi:MAG: AbrB/MazE/SpoVT family DNA-binding domain-containing protein [Candidatus Levybacteria bacterium]|nr:AbrB/MazE/SpoVT family DNA-binding domain-containing protein [Candidatus Levybacteria bacterium]
MVYTVTITSQGQISIPAVLRRELGLDKSKRAIVSVEDKKIVIEPVKDFLELGGSLHHKAIKGKTIDEIIRLEEEAVAKGFVDEYKKSKSKMDESILR